MLLQDEDYEFHSRYSTDGKSVKPAYFRVWGAGSVFIGLLPGLFAAWLVGRAVRRSKLVSPQEKTK